MLFCLACWLFLFLLTINAYFSVEFWKCSWSPKHSGIITMHELVWPPNGWNLKPIKLMEGAAPTKSRHKRSISDPLKRKSEENLPYNFIEALSVFPSQFKQWKSKSQQGSIISKKSRPTYTEAQRLLKGEIQNLQEQLQDQFVVRRALERALKCRPCSPDNAPEMPIPEPAEELIKEIALLESEIACLEQHLLCLYRRAFDEQLLSLSALEGRVKSTSKLYDKIYPEEVPRHETISETETSVFHSRHSMSPRYSIGYQVKECKDNGGPQMLLDSGICRSQSSLSQRSAGPAKSFRLADSLANAIDSYHSLPLSMMELAEAPISYKATFSEDLGTYASNYVSETPNWISEKMVKSISAIFCDLADPASTNDSYPSSPIAFPTAMNGVSLNDQEYTGNMNFSAFNMHIDSPLHSSGSREISRAYHKMLKVQWISRDSDKLKSVDYMLRKFRRLVSRLEEIHPKLMKHEEKLAFWINVHNSLAMHAFLIYGIPQNNLKRMSLVLQAAYNIGGRSISVDMIQSSILGCRLPRPGQWLRNLLTPKTKFKFGDRRKGYAIEHPEPLLCFALCSGSHSDPAVHVYTPDRVFQELEVAKAEYIQSTFSTKGKKVFLPKIVESYAKQSDTCAVGLMEMIEEYIPKSLIYKHQHKKDGKNIQWMPHNFSFSYIYSKELA